MSDSPASKAEIPAKVEAAIESGSGDDDDDVPQLVEMVTPQKATSTTQAKDQ